MRALPAATREHLLPVGHAAAAAPGAGTHRLSLLDAAPLASRRRGGAPQQMPPSSFELAGDRGQRNLDLAGPLVDLPPKLPSRRDPIALPLMSEAPNRALLTSTKIRPGLRSPSPFASTPSGRGCHSRSAVVRRAAA